jgi:heme-degrading monooxygenase HmoA
MHARVALYRLTSGTAEDVARRAEEGMLPIFRDQEGFRSYHLIATDEGTVISVSEWDDHDQAEEAAQLAATWVRQTIAELLELEQLHVGEVVLS